jgi:hypothetical protein
MELLVIGCWGIRLSRLRTTFGKPGRKRGELPESGRGTPTTPLYFNDASERGGDTLFPSPNNFREAGGGKGAQTTLLEKLLFLE